MPVALAFEAFTDRVDDWWPASHRKFKASTLRFEKRAGGRFFETSSDGEEAVFGEVRCWEPPHRLSYGWWPGAGAGPTEVDVRFFAEGSGTRVEVTHSEGQSGLGIQWTERAELFHRGWDAVLRAFTKHVALV